MRYLIVLLFLGLIGTPKLRALDGWTYDLPHLVRNAQTIVIGRVLHVAEVTAPDPSAELKRAVIATIAVKHLLQGTPTQQLQLVVRKQDLEQVLVGREFVFFLKPYDSEPSLFRAPWLSGRGYVATFGRFHFPHPIVPVDDDYIKIPDDLKGVYLTDVVPPIAEVETFKGLMTLIRGPVITVQVPDKSLPWDKPWSLSLSFDNPSTYPIPLLTCAIPDVPPNGTIIFIDQHGFDVGSAMGPLRLAGDGPSQSTVTIPAEGNLTGSITVTKPMIHLTGDPRTIRHMYVMYQALKSLDTLAAGWDAQVYTKVDVSFVSTTNAEADSLARSSSKVFSRLNWWQNQQDQPAAEMSLGLDVNPHRFVPNNTYGSRVHEPKPDERTILLNALQLEQNGIVIRPAQQGPALSALVTRLAMDHQRLAVTVTRAELATMAPPGNYTVRLILVHDDEQSLSNTLHFTIP